MPYSITEIISIATKRKWRENKEAKHKFDAKYGFYKYNSRVGLPLANGNAQIYNVKILIRNSEYGKKYLYDIVEIKKAGKASAVIDDRIMGNTHALSASKNSIDDIDAEVNTERHSIADGFESGDANVPRFSIREADPPKKTKGKIYKLLKLYPDGSLGALFIDKGMRLQVGEWYDADSPAIKDLENLETGLDDGTKMPYSITLMSSSPISSSGCSAIHANTSSSETGSGASGTDHLDFS